MEKLIVIIIVLLSSLPLMGKTKKVVFASANYAPYYYLNEDNEITGSAVAVTKKMAEHINLDVDFKIFPWKDCLSKVESGEIEGILTTFKVEERERFLFFPRFGTALEEFGVFTSPNYKGEKIVEIKSLEGLKVGFINNYIYPQELLDYAEYDKVYGNTQEDLMQLLAMGKIDVMIGDVKSGNFYLKKLENGEKCNLMPLVFSIKPSYLAISKKTENSKELYERINKELTRMKLSGEIYQIQSTFEKELDK
ncbi:MAG: hypothetical protein CR982_03545 [Candidatus Cloacimonadota bacterium]|nr:MAG: hypothetical protein CR982_03545 [Candidatus Cloacimonadota bacterium]PIE78314.1 MAG: hypothetical protein CSA15_08460 [Candidatus Delongbacteria bacterium]